MKALMLGKLVMVVVAAVVLAAQALAQQVDDTGGCTAAGDRGEPRRPQAGAGRRRPGEEDLHRRSRQALDAEPGGHLHH